MIIWITGISGAGKTTLGTCIYSIWKEIESNTVLIDGDVIREILLLDNHISSYTEEARHKIAQHYVKLCQWLDNQKINVVICTIANFEDIREQNRKLYSKYYEVYVKVPVNIAADRDIKGLYELAFAGKKNNVVGIDIPFIEPTKPDYIFDNSIANIDHFNIAKEILLKSGVKKIKLNEEIFKKVIK